MTMRNQKGSTTLIVVGIIVLLLIGTVFYFLFVNQSKPQPQPVKDETKTTSENSKSYKQSTGLKEIVSDKYKFKLSYPDQWSYYPKQQYIDTNLSLIPEFNGTTVEINVVKNDTNNTEQKFNSEPLALKDAFQPNYTVNNSTTPMSLKTRIFEGLASPSYLSSNNLQGDYKVKTVQFRGNSYSYVITTVYFLNSDTNLFLSDLDKLLSSFTLNQ